MSNTAKHLLFIAGRCQAKRQANYLSDTATTDRRCMHSAKYELNGIKMCAKHAQYYALQILLKETNNAKN